MMTDVKAIVAFDHTRVSWSQLEWAYKITPLFDAMLSNEEEKKAAAEESKETKGKQKKQQKPQKSPKQKK